MEDRQVKLSEDSLILSTEIWILRLQKNGFAEQKVDMTLSISKRITDMHMIFLRFYADALSFLAFLSKNKNRSRFLSVIFFITICPCIMVLLLMPPMRNSCVGLNERVDRVAIRRWQSRPWLGSSSFFVSFT